MTTCTKKGQKKTDSGQIGWIQKEKKVILFSDIQVWNESALCSGLCLSRFEPGPRASELEGVPHPINCGIYTTRCDLISSPSSQSHTRLTCASCISYKDMSSTVYWVVIEWNRLYQISWLIPADDWLMQIRNAIIRGFTKLFTVLQYRKLRIINFLTAH